MSTVFGKSSRVIKDSKLSSFIGFIPFTSIISVILVILLAIAFFEGHLTRFYASVLFLFYALTKSMWISVVLLGVFQTLLMIPMRVIRVWKSENIKEFQVMIKKLESVQLQRSKMKEKLRTGSNVFSFYLVDFMVQLTTFLTIGRLFLTDFYTRRLDPNLIYDFIPYPDYQIRDTFFKIPYPAVTGTVDLGWKAVITLWLVLIALQIILFLIGLLIKKFSSLPTDSTNKLLKLINYASGFFVLSLILSYFILRHFPTGVAIHIFSGDVSQQNTTFNTVTAIATFITFMWFGIPKIMRKGELAKAGGIPQDVIDATQKQMFKDTLFTSTVVALGAFYITNQIPSAFELSVFTFELISLTSPFTLDKIIQKSTTPQLAPPASEQS